MTKPEHVVNYIYLGYHLQRLYYPYGRQYTDVLEECKLFVRVTTHLGFMHVAAELATFIVDVQNAHEQNPESFKEQYLSCSGEVLPDKFKGQLNRIIRRFDEALQEQGKDWQVVRIDSSVVSDSLRKLHGNAVDEHQAILVDEAIRCLECGAHRSAIVMGWNLVLDHVRQWIFCSPKKRLKELNAVLTNNHRTPSQIVHYEDFFELPERILIEDAYGQGEIISACPNYWRSLDFVN